MSQEELDHIDRHNAERFRSPSVWGNLNGWTESPNASTYNLPTVAWFWSWSSNQPQAEKVSGDVHIVGDEKENTEEMDQRHSKAELESIPANDQLHINANGAPLQQNELTNEKKDDDSHSVASNNTVKSKGKLRGRIMSWFKGIRLRSKRESVWEADVEEADIEEAGDIDFDAKINAEQGKQDKNSVPATSTIHNPVVNETDVDSDSFFDANAGDLTESESEFSRPMNRRDSHPKREIANLNLELEDQSILLLNPDESKVDMQRRRYRAVGARRRTSISNKSDQSLARRPSGDVPPIPIHERRSSQASESSAVELQNDEETKS